MSDARARAAVAHRAAVDGGSVAATYGDDLEVATKDGRTDVVTAADGAAQERVIERIAEAYPEDPIVGEEEGDGVLDAVPGDGLAWIVDPIDGTYNYVRDMVYWATCVAVVRDGEPLAAATVLPALGERFVAGAEEVRHDGRTVSVSDRTDPATFVVTPIALPPFGRRHASRAGIADLFERFGDVRRIGSIQITLALIASGALEGTVTASTTNPWDTVGGVHMVRLAGGTVTDADGNPWRPDSRGLVASNGTAHEELLAVAKRLDGRDGTATPGGTGTDG
jgi:myo-inositol-1(or 4)-monophosphatase